MKKNKNYFRIALAGVSLLGIAGLGVASAANLGINANNDLGAGTSVTASCQPAGASNDIKVGFAVPAYVPASKTFTVTDVNLTNIDAACFTKKYTAVVADATGASLVTVSGVVSTASQVISLPAPVDTAGIGSVSVVIYDN